jgi:signal transduction histidine kinase
LQQVLLNLILNGMDAMAGCAKGERRLVVRVKAVEAGGAQVAVCDCGMGIQSEKIEQVFQPFFTTKSHGMGMGLALSRTIIEAHGGRIWAENNPTRGATFRFVLPGMPVSAKLESEKGLGKPELSPGHA